MSEYSLNKYSDISLILSLSLSHTHIPKNTHKLTSTSEKKDDEEEVRSRDCDQDHAACPLDALEDGEVDDENGCGESN